MKRHIYKTFSIGLLILTSGTLCAQQQVNKTDDSGKNEAAEKAAIVQMGKKEEIAKQLIKDSTVVYTYKDGKLMLEDDNSGSLYCYAIGKEGYKEIYYLFTSRPYIHLGDSSSATDKEYMLVKDSKGSWKNLLTNQPARPNNNFPMKGNTPYRCLVWDKREAQLSLSVNKKEQLTANSILLIILPKREEPQFNPRIIMHGDTIPSKNINLNAESQTPLLGYTFIIKRTNSIIVDSILYAGKRLDIGKDTPRKPINLVFPLDTLNITSENKELIFDIFYREFDKNGIIKEKNCHYPIALTWNDGKKHNLEDIIADIIDFIANIIPVIIIIAVSGIFLAVYLYVRNKDKKRSSNFNKGVSNNPQNDGNSDPENEGGSDSENEGDSQDDNTNKDKEKSDLIETITLLKREKNELEKRVKSLEDNNGKLEENIQILKNEKERERQRAENAEKKARDEAGINTELRGQVEKAAEAAKTAAKTADKAVKEVKEAKKKAKEAEERANEAEAKAIKKVEKEIEKIKKESERKLAEEKNKTEEAKKQIEVEKEKAEKDIAEAKFEITRECHEEMEKINKLADRLKELLDETPDDAFGGTGLVLKTGVESYCNKLKTLKGLNLSLKSSFDIMREYTLVQLNIGSSCWIHSLGRIYSYMSVETLCNQLEYEGMKLDIIAEAFRSLTALLAIQGIVVWNCSPGFDSNKDPMTNKLFKLDMQIDRISGWLDGSENVRHAIPNHGNTIYDFGTLAYYTYECTEIHQGKVIYYDE